MKTDPKWAEAASDFAKYGIAPICTAVVALFVARFTQSHQKLQDRLRRKEDFLERFLECSDELQDRVEEALKILVAFESSRINPQAQAALPILQAQLRDTLRIVDESERKISVYESKFKLFGFSDGLEAYRKHQLLTTTLKTLILQCLQGNAPMNMVAVAREHFWDSKRTLVTKLTTIFEKL
ncbi:MAG TPA: hypothetical protein VGI60_01130 [Chthoniobacterales bacterium]|jgi:hypothetical protein